MTSMNLFRRRGVAKAAKNMAVTAPTTAAETTSSSFGFIDRPSSEASLIEL
jgi:hypothetical protein